MTTSPVIRIFVACHKPSYVPDNPLFFPIQVGTALRAETMERMLHDDEGNNISEKNGQYCELTAQYWVWKHVDCDYYGFFHYRRYLNFHRVSEVASDGSIKGKKCCPYEELDSIWDDLSAYHLDDAQWMQDLIIKYALLTVYRERINTSVYRQYEQYHDVAKLKRAIAILKQMYPQYASAADEYMQSKDIYYMSIFIMKKALYHEYMEWLFSILFQLEKELECEKEKEPRLMGYIAERLFGIFYCYQRKQGIRCAELPYLKFYNTEPGKEETAANLREFRLKPTKIKIRIDMRKLNHLFPAGSRRRLLLRGLFLK